MKMLLKYSAAQKKIRSSNGKLARSAPGAMRSGTVNNLQRHRKVLNKNRLVVKREQVQTIDPCDNSNDSGLGFDHHPVDSHSASTLTPFNFPQSSQKSYWLEEEPPDLKRRRPDVKIESDNANAEYAFLQNPAMCITSGGRSGGPCGGSISSSLLRPTRRIYGKRLQNISINSPISTSSRDPKTYLQIICQPEQQHRARYQTEGSRGAVKDRTGNGFPVVKLVGYAGHATLEVFIGTDQGKIAPHMFYQACRVAGKNSTPCVEKKMEGTVVIEIDFDPAKDMAVTCDCVGILKERNVDVEQRFPEESCARSKKKSTRCRMVFRTTLTNQITGETEILQVASQPIVCTQPPGVPEICKKSLSTCPVSGGAELFILGKNFLKDTQVVFRRTVADMCIWEQTVVPDKEFLQQSHLVCKVPPYEHLDIKEPVGVTIRVISSNRSSEPQTFVYTPETSHLWQPALPLKNEHLGPRIMPPPPSSLVLPPPPSVVQLNHIYAPSKKLDPAGVLSSSQKLDALVNSAADSHIHTNHHPASIIPSSSLHLLSASVPQDEPKMSLLPVIINKDSFSGSGGLIGGASSSAVTTQHQIVREIYNKGVSEVNSLLKESSTASCSEQCIYQEMINKSVADTNSLLNSAVCAGGATPQEIIQDMIITKSVSEATDSVLRENKSESSVQLLQDIMDKTEENLKKQLSQSPPSLISTSCASSAVVSPQQQIIEHIIQKTEQELKQQLHEASSSQQLMQTMNDEFSRASSIMSDSCSDGSNSPPQQCLITKSDPDLKQSFTDSSNLMSSSSASSSPQQLIQDIIKSEDNLSMHFSQPSLMDEGTSSQQSQLLAPTLNTPDMLGDETSSCMLLEKNEPPLSYNSGHIIQQMMQKSSEDLKMQTLVSHQQSSSGGSQNLLLMMDEPRAENGLTFRGQTNSAPDEKISSTNLLVDYLNPAVRVTEPPETRFSPTNGSQSSEDVRMLPATSKMEVQFSETAGSTDACQTSPSSLVVRAPSLNGSSPLMEMMTSNKSENSFSSTDAQMMTLITSSAPQEIKMSLDSSSPSSTSQQMLDTMIVSTTVPSIEKPSAQDLKLEFTQASSSSTVPTASEQMLQIINPDLQKPADSMDVQFSQVQPADPVAIVPESVNRVSTLVVSSSAYPESSTQMRQILVKSEEPNKDISSDITQMSAKDLLSYINPSCFDNVPV